jgi:hypothetical protein
MKVGDLSFPTGFWQVLVLALLCSGPAVACVVKDSNGRPAFAVEGPLNWHCVPRGPGKSETSQGDIDFAPVDGRRGWGERITLEPGGMTLAGMFHNLNTGSDEDFGVDTLRTRVETALAQGDVATWFPGYLGPAPKVGVPRWLVRAGDPVSMEYPFACTPHPGMDFTCEGLRPLPGNIYLHFTLTAPILPVSDWGHIEAQIHKSVLEAIVPASEVGDGTE